MLSKKILVFIIVIVVLVILYYVYLRNSFQFIKGLDSYGNDLPLLNAEFQSKGDKSLAAAKAFALSKPEIVGFVKLNGGGYFFKQKIEIKYTPCPSNNCTEPDTGLYIK